MRRTIVASTAAVLALAMTLLPSGTASPAQAADAVRSLSCISSVTCNPANLPIVAEVGIGSAGGVTTATAATGAATATGLAGTLGFGTVVGASGAAVGLGLLKVYGVEEGLYVETDPEYDSGVVPGQGPTVVYEDRSVTYLGKANASGTVIHCFRFTGSPDELVVMGTVNPGLVFALAANATRDAVCASTFGGLGSEYRNTPEIQRGDIVRYGYRTAEGVWLAQSDDFELPQEGYHGTIRTTVGCRAPGSSQLSYVTASARVDVEQGARLPVPPARCDVGIAASVKVEYQADGTTQWVELGSGDAKSYVERWPVDYPDCFNGTLTCALELWRVSDGGMLASCGEVGQYCPSWAAEAKLNPNAYRCTYGPYDVTLAHCSVYRDPSVGVLPNDSGEEDEDGKPVPLPIDAPVPDPLPNPMTNPDGTPAPSPGGESSQPRECFPAGWGVFNPVEWVLKPIRCAFEPSPEKVEDFKASIRNRWEASAPGVVVTGIIGAAGAVTAAVVGGTGCEGISIPTGWLNRDAFANAGFPASFTILNACEGSPLAPWATFCYWVIAAAMIVLAIRVLPGMVGKLINFGGTSG